jgi:hypothetical protein
MITNVLKEPDVSVFRTFTCYFRMFMVSNKVINVVNEPDAFFFREFTYFLGFIVSHMITHVSNTPDASIFRKTTKCFTGSTQEMHNVSIFTGNKLQNAGSKV